MIFEDSDSTHEDLKRAFLTNRKDMLKLALILDDLVERLNIDLEELEDTAESCEEAAEEMLREQFPEVVEDVGFQDDTESPT